MNTAGSNELAYASVAILVALAQRLIDNKIIEPDEIAAALNDANTTLKSFGNLVDQL